MASPASDYDETEQPAKRSWFDLGRHDETPSEPLTANEPEPEPEHGAGNSEGSATTDSTESSGSEPEPPVVSHPAAGDSEPFPLADPGEYYIGLWSGKPNYGCPYCGFATLEGSGRVELHILERIDHGSLRHLPALDKK